MGIGPSPIDPRLPMHRFPHARGDRPGGSDGMTAADFAGLWGKKLAKVLGDAVPDVGPAAANPSPSGIPDDAFRKAVSAVLEPTKSEKVSAVGNALYNLSAPDLGLSSFRRRPTIAIGRG